MSTQGNGFSFFKWEGPLDARKIVERTIAGVAANMVGGLFLGIGFYLSTVVVKGWF